MDRIEEIADEIARAAEAGDTDWPKHEDFRQRFGVPPEVDSHLLTGLVEKRGWTIKPFRVEDFKIVKNGLNTGYDLPSGMPLGYRLVRS